MKKMRCFNHAEADAVAICLGCGRSLCQTCCQTTDSGTLVCSDACREKIKVKVETLNYIRDKTMIDSRATGVFTTFVGVILGLTGLFLLMRPRNVIFIAVIALAVVMTVAGITYLRVTKAKK